MKISNKKLVNVLILILVFLVLLSTFAYADAFTQSFAGGLKQINDFFAQEQYKPFAKAIDFFFFSLLFIAIYMMGVRYAFKEVKRPEQVIAILLGLMTAFLMVLGGFSATMVLPYIHWLLYLLLFLFYWWLLKGIKSKFWRFILALLLTLLTIALLQGLFAALAPPEVKGVETGISGFFKSIGDLFKGIQIPGVEAPGVPDWLRDIGAPAAPAAPVGPEVLPTVPTPVEEKPGKGGIFGTGIPWWTLAIVAGVILLALSGAALWRRRRAGPPSAPPEAVTPEVVAEELTIEQIIEKIEEYLNKKKEVLQNIYDLYKVKKKLQKNFIDEYHKVLHYVFDPNVDPALMLDPDSTTGKKLKEFLATKSGVHNLIKWELQIEKMLAELLKIEYELAGTAAKRGDIKKWEESLKKIFFKSQEHFASQKPEEQEAYHTLSEIYLPKLIESCDKAKLLLQKYYSLTKTKVKKEKELEDLLDAEKFEAWVTKGRIEKWRNLIQMKALTDANSPTITQYLTDTEPNFLKKQLFPTINRERAYLKYIHAIIKYLQDINKKTVVQELRVEPKEASQESGVEYGTPIKVWTLVALGVAPFTAYCYIYKEALDIDPVTRKTKGVNYIEVYPGKRPKIPRRTRGMPDDEYKRRVEEYERLFREYKEAVEISSHSVQKIISEQVKFTTDDFGYLQPGKYKIVFFVRGSLEVKRFNWDRKEAKIVIKQRHPVGVNIIQPASYTLYTAGEPINLEAQALDGRGAPVDLSTYSTYARTIFNWSLIIAKVHPDFGLREWEQSFFTGRTGTATIHNDAKTGDVPLKVTLRDIRTEQIVATAERIIRINPPGLSRLRPSALTVHIKAEILMPSRTPKPVLHIGENILGLEAHVVGLHGLVRYINNEQGFIFLWYILQEGKPLATIHIGRRSTNSNEIIPLYFDKGDAKLGVEVYNEDRQRIAHDFIEVELKKSEGGKLALRTPIGMPQYIPTAPPETKPEAQPVEPTLAPPVAPPPSPPPTPAPGAPPQTPLDDVLRDFETFASGVSGEIAQRKREGKKVFGDEE